MADTTTVQISPDETTIQVESGAVTISNECTVVVGSDTAGPQGIQGIQGPPGADGAGFAVTAIAGEALSAGRLVTLVGDNAFYFDSTDLADYGKLVGITEHAAALAAVISITTIGPVTLAGIGFTPGARFWAGVNGTLLTTAPVSGMVVPVGYATDADTINVQIGSYLQW